MVTENGKYLRKTRFFYPFWVDVAIKSLFFNKKSITFSIFLFKMKSGIMTNLSMLNSMVMFNFFVLD